jgi:hypothetical protein
MENFSWTQIIVAAFASGGVVATVIKVFTFITERIDKRKALETQKAQQIVADAVELRKVELEADHVNEEAVKQAIWDLLKEKKEENEALKREVRELLQVQALSRPIVEGIYQALRRLRKQLDILITLIQRLEHHDDLLKEAELVQQAISDVEARLP